MLEVQNPVKVSGRAKQPRVRVAMVRGDANEGITISLSEGHNGGQCFIKRQLIIKQASDIVRMGSPITLPASSCKTKPVRFFRRWRIAVSTISVNEGVACASASSFALSKA